MSDTFFIKNLKCAYCGKNNDFEEESAEFGNPGLPYTFEFRGEFVCDGCKEKNNVVMDFVAVKGKASGAVPVVGSGKDFDAWNEVKKRTHAERPRLYTVREIWWCKLGVNIGTEQDGKGEWYDRPCVILRGFGADACLVVPLTTSAREHSLRVPIGLIEGQEAKANLSQIRVIDTRRLEEKVGFLEAEAFSNLRKAARDLFSDGFSDCLPLAGARPKPTVQL